MQTFRRILFWCHLCCGVTAGVIVLVMSVTGVLLTYQRQMQWWADTRQYHSAPASGAERLGSAVLLDAVARLEGGTPTAIALRADPAAPAAVTVGTKTIYVNPYTAAVYGEGTGAGLRAFFAKVVAWHRYIAFEGGSRPIGKGVADAANLIFLFIVLSGMYLWWPRSLRWTAIRNITWFRSGLTPKARDFNWHNVFGFWTALPLAIVVFGGVVISYPWATNLVYRAVGDTPPPPAAGRAGGAPAGTVPGSGGRVGGGDAAARSPATHVAAAPGREAAGRGPNGTPDRRNGEAVATGALLDAALGLAMAGEPDWKILTARPPASPGAPASVMVDRGDGGQPHLRSTVTIDTRTMAVARWERFEDQSAGRRARSFFRFAHTGEYAGLVGQTVAGIASAAGAVLVYSGLALSVRRFATWRARRAARVIVGQTAT